MGKSAVSQRGRETSSNPNIIDSVGSGVTSASPKSLVSGNPSDVPKNMPPSSTNSMKNSKQQVDSNIAGRGVQQQQPHQQPLPNIHSRKNSTNSNFLFNTQRNDSLNSIVNNYSSNAADIPKTTSSSTNSIEYPNSGGSAPGNSGPKSLSMDSNFATFYRRDSSVNPVQNFQLDSASARPRGDSIYLPPPINSQIRTDYDQSAQQIPTQQQQQQQLQHQQQQQQQQQQGQQQGYSQQGVPSQHPQLNSRANSIFNSIIQFPASNQNSISGPSGNPSKSNSISNPTFSAGGSIGVTSKSRLPSLGGGEFAFNPQEFDFLSKDNSGSISWQQQQLQQQQQMQMLMAQSQNPNIPLGSLSKSKRGSLENLGWDQNTFESIVGFPLNSDSISNILAGITNGSIQLSGTNNERRDSVLKYLNDVQQPLYPQQQQQPQQHNKPSRITDKKGNARTKLREDIFDKANNNNAKVTFSDQVGENLIYNQGNVQYQHQNTLRPHQKNPEDSVDPVSPSTSSISSKTSNTKAYSRDDEPQSPKTSPQGYHAKMKVDKNQQQRGRNPQYGGVQGYVPGGYQQMGGAQNIQGNQRTTKPAAQQNLVPAQEFVQAEDGRPLLGATKIDQLMLVIQARDNGINTAIPQGADGSILANPDTVIEQSRMHKPVVGVIPQPIGLVGGIEKPGKIHRINEEGDGEDGAQGSVVKRRSKDHQCPYCFKYFTQSTHLDVHVRSHIGYKPFECLYCHKRFTQGGNLRTHLRLHTGEKPFTCQQCNRSFSRKGNLAAHLLTHKNEKPFECKLDGCDKAFTQLGNLKSHQNRFHLESLNALTHRLAELTGDQLNNLPHEEKELLEYFKELYKNSNKGIRGRGKKSGQFGNGEHEEVSPQMQTPRLAQPQHLNRQHIPPPQNSQAQDQQLPPPQSNLQQSQILPQYGYDNGYKNMAK